MTRERQMLEQEHDWQLKQERDNLSLEHRMKVKELLMMLNCCRFMKQ